MKKLSTYLFLILFSFSAPSFGDDISDFQSEGMSIGDSALDFFSEEEIKKELFSFPDDKDKTFIHAEFYKLPFFKVYDSIQIAMKTNDTKYIIHAVRSGIFYDNNIDSCYKKMDEIAEELSEVFKNGEKEIQKKRKHSLDESGKSTTEGVAFFLKSGNASVRCYDWSKEMSYTDNLNVTIKTKEYNEWLK